MFWSPHLNFNPLRKRSPQRSSALMATLMIMLGLSALIGLTSEQAVRFLESQRTSSLHTSMNQFEETLLQALQSSFYEEYRRIAAETTRSKIISPSDLDTIVSQAYQRLGIVGNSGTSLTIPHSSGNEIKTKIECTFPAGFTSLDTQAKTPYEAIQGTYSWLDGIAAVQKSIQVEIQLEGKNSFSQGTYQITRRYQLKLLEIPAENISLSSLGNVTLPSLNIQTTSGYFGGNIQGGTGIEFQDRLISGDRRGSHVKGPHHSDETSEGWSSKGYSEIVSTNSVRNLNEQRSPGLGTAIKSSYFFREGLVASGTLTPAEQAQMKSFQPYYQVPPSQRIYGIHQPSAVDASSAFTFYSGSGDEVNTTSLPLWCTIQLETNTVPKVQFLVDLSNVPPDINNEIRVFVGSRLNSLTGSFQQAEVLILPWENIPADRKITVISSNPIVITGNFNQGANPVSAHFFAQQVFYGLNSASQLDFQGSYANYQQNSPGSSIDFRSRDGATASTRNIQLQSASSPTLHASHHYYYLVLKSKIP